MEASRGSMCWLFWVLTYTHAFYQIPHPCINNAVLDYSSRIWIYLRRAPIKVQIGRSMRPTQTSPSPFLGFVVEMLLSVLGSGAATPHKTQKLRAQIAEVQNSFAYICQFWISMLAAPQSLDSLNLESVFAVRKHVCNPQERSYCYTK